MPKTQTELFSRIVEVNRAATHHRGLGSNYGYGAILDVNLVRICTQLHRLFEPPIRILDIGCGNGFALKQLGDALENAGMDRSDFSLWGIGLNRYDDMHIDPEQFVMCGLNAYDPGEFRFHLVISVFTFHYLWHKLEGVEKIYNQLLEEGGLAYLHFPGYLIRFGETHEALNQDEHDGNARFRAFLAGLVEQGAIGPMQYALSPHYSDDDDRTLLAEFGHLRFEKRGRRRIRFGRKLLGFAIFTRGFQFGRMDLLPLTYVASHYDPEPDAPATSAPPLPPYRITSLLSTVQGREVDIDVAVHPYESDTVALLCPGAFESLAGNAVTYQAVAGEIQHAGLGAVVRYGDPDDRDGDYSRLVVRHLRRVLDCLLETAPSFCAVNCPRLKVMAYSSSAGAIAALAADYPCIEALLLVAPSFDVPRERILPSLERFAGELYVLIGSSDAVVLPRQAFWYCRHARSARVREYVEIPACGHNFEGAANQALFTRAALWAFGRQRPAGFPAARTEPTDIY